MDLLVFISNMSIYIKCSDVSSWNCLACNDESKRQAAAVRSSSLHVQVLPRISDRRYLIKRMVLVNAECPRLLRFLMLNKFRTTVQAKIHNLVTNYVHIHLTSWNKTKDK
jgi:hypothetical protein